MFNNNSIIITTNTNKKEILKNNKELKYYKIYTISEFNKLYFFDYDEETIYYVMTKYNVNYEIAKIYINNLIYIEEKEYNNKKLRFLSELKKDLLTNNKIIINKLFIESLNNKNITIYNLPLTKELQSLIDKIKINNNIEIINEKNKNYIHKIYHLDNIENEVVFIANKICKLIKDGIKISNIYITNIDDEYKKLIKKIFPMFNINITLNENKTIYGTHIVNEFINNYNNDLQITIDYLKNIIKTQEDEEVLNKIINIINDYTFIDNKEDIKEIIKIRLKNTNISNKDNKNSIHEVSLKEYIFKEDDYVFLPSFNQTIIPTIYKDEDYLTDNDKKELNISYTVDKNILEKNIIKEKISNIKNLIITYKDICNGEEYNISNINEDLNYEIEEITKLDLSYSNKYNKIKLASLLDEYYKYNTTSELLSILNTNYKDIKYNTFDNKFTGINKQDLKEYLNNKITLSYSSLDKYFKCPFSFYISKILKLDIYEETFYQIVGTLFHAILEKQNTYNGTYDELWQQEINNIDYTFNKKEQFFLKKLKEELQFIIDVINNQENFTNLHDELHEERIYTSISGDISITFTGIIDKIKYNKKDNETIIAIIDYKTGNPNLDLTTIPYGIGMQLPVYLYLAKNSKKLENIKVAGFYLQKILNNEVTVDKNTTYEQQKKKNLLLQGYSNYDMNILSEFDNSYIDSNIIKSMKVKKDNEFYSYSKVLTNEQMDIITNIAEEKIKEGSQDIINAKFDIAPKRILKDNYGCNLCKYKDICFKTEKDVVELEKIKLSDIIGGEEDETDSGTTISD